MALNAAVHVGDARNAMRMVAMRMIMTLGMLVTLGMRMTLIRRVTLGMMVPLVPILVQIQ